MTTGHHIFFSLSRNGNIALYDWKEGQRGRPIFILKPSLDAVGELISAEDLGRGCGIGGINIDGGDSLLGLRPQSPRAGPPRRDYPLIGTHGAAELARILEVL